MNVIQIQDLIIKIGELNKKNGLQDYFNNGDEILKLELEIIEFSTNELNQRLLIQLKEKSDIELLQGFVLFINMKGRALEELYHKYRIKLSESNNSNPIYSKSIPMICKLIDIKLDVLTSLYIDLQSKIKYFNYRISSDFQLNQNSFFISEFTPNQNDEKGTAGKATFNTSKKESLMLLFILEQTNFIKFDNSTQRRSFIEQNFNFTEVRNNEFYGKSFPMAGIQSEYSKFNSNDRDELKSNNKTLENLFKKLTTIMEEFEFIKKTKH